MPSRTSLFIDGRQSLVFDFVFSINTGQASDTEGFVGVMMSDNSALSALPTTAAHMGVFWDRSADTDYFLTSGNGSAQVTTDTGSTVQTSQRRLRITWTDLDTAVLELFSGTDLLTSVGTQNITDLGANELCQIHFFVQTEANVVKGLRVVEWSLKVL